MLSTALISAAILALSSTAKAQKTAPPQDSGLSLTTQLRLVDSAADRYALLPDDDDWVFDFNDSDTGMANAKSFPPLVGANAAMAFAELPGCAVVATHIHPRSSELFAVAKGRVLTESIPEGGVVDADGNPRVIRTELGPLQMTVFHQGAFHTQMNPDCDPVVAVAGFASEDPGFAPIASQLFALSDGVLVRQFDGALTEDDIDKIRDSLSADMMAKHDECRAKCGMGGGAEATATASGVPASGPSEEPEEPEEPKEDDDEE